MGEIFCLLIVFVVIYVWIVASKSPASNRRAQRSNSSERTRTSAPRNRLGSGHGGSRVKQHHDYFHGEPPQNIAEAVSESELCWVPPGESTEVAGYVIPDGMVYVGRKMRSPSSGNPDPALIVPSLQVIKNGMDRSGDNLHYWPAYSSIPPTSRAAYLDWLSGGRRDPNANISYVFLFFYGIERRILLDARHSNRAKAEIPELAREVENLIGIYGDNHSFWGYASRFLDFADLLAGPVDVMALKPPNEAGGWEYPLRLKLALGAMSNASAPIPAEWALAWLRCTPGLSLRTPAKRCREEFDQLFGIRYQKKYDEGLRIKPNKARLTAGYRPASSTFRQEVDLQLPDLPDVTRLEGPANKLRRLADMVCDELDAYSRWLGRHDNQPDLSALALLPRELLETRTDVNDELAKDLKGVISLIEKALTPVELAKVEASPLIKAFSPRPNSKITKGEAELLAELLARFGYGIEPDIRYGSPNMSSTEFVSVFRLPGADETPSDTYHSATVLLHLGTLVAAADEEITTEEQNQLGQHLDLALSLPESDRRRLKAHLQWLLSNPPNFRGLKRRIASLPQEERQIIGQFLITVAGADGHVSSDELKVLERTYPLLGLEADTVYTDVHAMATPGPAPDRGPVTVLPAQERTGFKIPEPEVTGKAEAVVLDMAKVATIRERSLQAAELLRNVFVAEEEPEVTEYHGVLKNQYNRDTQSPIGGLDIQHSILLRALSERGQWSRSEYEALAKKHDLMPEGAMEIINEAAFEICEEPLLEGFDPIHINPYAIKEVQL